MISKERLKTLFCTTYGDSCPNEKDKSCSNECHGYKSMLRTAQTLGLLTEPEMAWHQRSAEEIQASLDRLGYVKDEEGNWIHPIFPNFWVGMWEACNKNISSGIANSRLTEWVELREVQE